MKKFILFLLAALPGIFVYGQNCQHNMHLHFTGCEIVKYVRAINLMGNRYEPSFKDLGEAPDQGQIIIEECTGTFTIKWKDGDKWMGRFTSKVIKKGNAGLEDETNRILYTGKWIDDGSD